jgi:hypothetical protein
VEDRVAGKSFTAEAQRPLRDAEEDLGFGIFNHGEHGGHRGFGLDVGILIWTGSVNSESLWFELFFSATLCGLCVSAVKNWLT